MCFDNAKGDEVRVRYGDDNVAEGIRRTLNPYMDIILRLLGLAGIFVSFGEGVEGLEVFDGHKLGLSR
jgi:hypothetical protein